MGWREAAARQYLPRVDAGHKQLGRVPVQAQVELAERESVQAIAASVATHALWAALDAGPAQQRQ